MRAHSRIAAAVLGLGLGAGMFVASSDAAVATPTTRGAGTAAYVVRPNLDITLMRVSAPREGLSRVRVELTNSGGRVAYDARVRLEDNGRFVRVSNGFTIPAHTTQQLVITWPTKGKHGQHELVTIADPRNHVAESNENDNRARRVVALP